MSGRKQFDRDTALDQAMQVFWQWGYAGASVGRLGAATGLGRGSLYGAFGDKDALFQSCLDRYAATYGSQYEQALSAHPGEPAEAVKAFFDVVLDRIADPAVPEGCLIAQSASQSPILSPDSRSRVQALLTQQHQRIHEALFNPDIDPRELNDVATFVVAVNQSLAVLSRAGTSDADLRSVVRLACTTVAATHRSPGGQER